MTVATPAWKYVGRSVRRKEDPRLITGRAQFVADIRLPGMLHAAIVRSDQAHARITGIDTAKAKRHVGVVAVYTGHDLHGKVEDFPPLLHKVPPALFRKVEIQMKEHRAPVLARDEVFRVGEPVAVVVATDPATAADAVELVRVEYEPLPHVLDIEEALRPQATVLFPEFGDNVQCSFRIGSGDVEAALAGAPRRMAERFELRRQVGSPIETRGVVAVHEPGKNSQRLVIWSATQMPHFMRGVVAGLLGLPIADLQVIAPDMGGSFGGGVYNEDILIPFLAMELGAPVRWIESRSENLTNTRHSRDQVHDVQVGFDGGGRIVALKDRFVMNAGAYNFFGVILPFNTATHLRGQYRIENFEAESITVVTNKTPNSPVRGAGRMEAAFVIERVLDLVAREVGLDPAEVRRKNLVPTAMIPYDSGVPYRDGKPFIYDSADFESQLDMALEASRYKEFRSRQSELQPGGRRRGIGLANYIEAGGYGPHEGAVIRIETDGRVVIATGANPHGQGHETTLAQVCADVLKVDIDWITVRSGDTALLPFGGGTFASRSAVTAGSAVFLATEKVRKKALAIAAHLLEAEPADLVLAEGKVHPVGAPGRALTLAEIATAAAPGPAAKLPAGMEPVLQAEHYFVPPTVTLSSGTHVATVEVDEETGEVEVIDYVVVHDCGRALNPKIVDGQVEGGVVHGIGAALLEEVLYDEHGSVQSAGLHSYLLPTADVVPPLTVVHQECLSKLNPLGAKGVGEGGAVGPPGAIANAVADALRPLDVRITEVPITPERLLALIRAAKNKSG